MLRVEAQHRPLYLQDGTLIDLLACDAEKLNYFYS